MSLIIPFVLQKGCTALFHSLTTGGAFIPSISTDPLFFEKEETAFWSPLLAYSLCQATYGFSECCWTTQASESAPTTQPSTWAMRYWLRPTCRPSVAFVIVVLLQDGDTPLHHGCYLGLTDIVEWCHPSSFHQSFEVSLSGGGTQARELGCKYPFGK